MKLILSKDLFQTWGGHPAVIIHNINDMARFFAILELKHTHNIIKPAA